MPKPRDPIKTYRWKQLARRVLAEEPNCWLCGLPIDTEAKPRTRWAGAVDHVIPRKQGGPLYDRTNLHASHYGCNSSKGGDIKGRPPTPHSRPW